ncbi:MAG: 3-phosphoshikimate 1-carboxyvinyltransferase [Candidatus Omnitrophota bacterium]|jgi:3-phosphoshikimate 1-carboxyvinyltransferase
MKQLISKKSHKLRLTLRLPGDKSLSHRAAIFSSIATGVSRIGNFLLSEDCLNTMRIFKQMGVRIKKVNSSTYVFYGQGIAALKEPKDDLYCGNSGTTMRLLSGLLSGLPFKSRLKGDASLHSRPMNRIILPLKQMGANIIAEGQGGRAPLLIEGKKLKGIKHTLAVPSAQVKSSMILAALSSSVNIQINEPIATRDHTETYLRAAKVPIKTASKKITLKPTSKIQPVSWVVPGDISSAAFLLGAAALVPDSKIKIKDVLYNKHRIGFVRCLKKMGVALTIQKNKKVGPETTATITAAYNKNLKPITVQEDEVPSMIDELPMLMVVATQAHGQSIIHGIEELRVKETNRVDSMVNQLRKMGANIEVKKNSIYIEGPNQLKGATIQSFGDHRTAMSFVIAGFVATGKTQIKNIECIATSFPEFTRLFRKAGAKLVTSSKN